MPVATTLPDFLTEADYVGYLNSLETALFSGAQSVNYEGKSVSYRNFEEMRLIRNMLRNLLGLNSGRSSTIYVAHNPGFTPSRDNGE